jgi:hypothetical protein
MFGQKVVIYLKKNWYFELKVSIGLKQEKIIILGYSANAKKKKNNRHLFFNISMISALIRKMDREIPYFKSYGSSTSSNFKKG